MSELVHRREITSIFIRNVENKSSKDTKLSDSDFRKIYRYIRQLEKEIKTLQEEKIPFFTSEDFKPINFGIWNLETAENDYVYQSKKSPAGNIHAVKLGHDVLIINHEAPLKVESVEAAVHLVNLREGKIQ